MQWLFIRVRHSCFVVATIALAIAAPASAQTGAGADSCVERYQQCNGDYSQYQEGKTIRCVADVLRCSGADAAQVRYLFTPEKAIREWYRNSQSASRDRRYVCHETADRCSRLCHETLGRTVGYSYNATTGYGAVSIVDSCDRVCLAQADRCSASTEG